MSATRSCDVIVVGAGPAGLFLAAELTRLGVSVALLERQLNRPAGTRAIGVHSPTLAALEPSGATARILAGAARIPRGIARTRDRVLGEVRFDRTRARFPFVATVPQAVTEAAVAAGGPDALRGVRVRAVAELADRVIVTTETGAAAGVISARAVVIAAGAAGRGLVAPLLEARSRVYPDRYLMTDLAAAPTQPRDTAVVTIDPAGVLESFPLPGGGRRLVAWVAEQSSGCGSAPEHAIARLQRAVAERTGDPELAERVTRAQSFGIRRVLLSRMRHGRVFAIGDAAHEVSPIGGQGMNLALLDAAGFAPALARWLRHPEASAELERWERTRLASARTAARLAHLNTATGRARSANAHRFASLALGAALGGPLARAAAGAYAMGFDRDAAFTPRGRR